MSTSLGISQSTKGVAQSDAVSRSTALSGLTQPRVASRQLLLARDMKSDLLARSTLRIARELDKTLAASSTLRVAQDLNRSTALSSALAGVREMNRTLNGTMARHIEEMNRSFASNLSIATEPALTHIWEANRTLNGRMARMIGEMNRSFAMQNRDALSSALTGVREMGRIPNIAPMLGLSAKLETLNNGAYDSIIDDLIERAAKSQNISSHDSSPNQTESRNHFPDDFDNHLDEWMGLKPSRKDIVFLVVGYMISKGLDQVWFWF